MYINASISKILAAELEPLWISNQIKYLYCVWFYL